MDYFYRDTAILYDAGMSESYEAEREFTMIKSIKCDVQPISGALKDEEHGMMLGGRLKIFCDADDDITVGKYLEFDGAFYIITAIERWRMGYELLAQRRDL